MPFTASHPAAVLPLLGIGLPPAALVVGSMVPDLPYFVPGPLHGETTHSLHGLVTIDLVLGLVCLLVWWVLLAPAFVAVLPAAARDRLPSGITARMGKRLGAPSALPSVLLSLLVGGSTHVLWDSFTHRGRWGVHHVGWLDREHGPVMGYTWAQHGSTLLGLVVLTFFAIRWWRRARPDRSVAHARVPGRVAVGAAAAVVVAGVAGGAAGALPAVSDGAQLSSVAFDGITRGGLCAGAMTVLAAVAVRVLAKAPGA